MGTRVRGVCLAMQEARGGSAMTQVDIGGMYRRDMEESTPLLSTYH